MDGERISLRLEPEDLELLDDFIMKHPEYSNRSNFARVAIRSFIEQFDGDRTETAKSGKKKDCMVMVEVPKFAHEVIMSSVRAGIFISPEHAVLDCVNKRFNDTDEAIERMKKQKLEVLSGTVQVVSD